MFSATMKRKVKVITPEEALRLLERAGIVGPEALQIAQRLSILPPDLRGGLVVPERRIYQAIGARILSRGFRIR
jgi:hypothetical protein